MSGWIAGVLISFFAVVGLTEVCRGIRDCLLLPRHGRCAFVLCCKGHDESLEYQVRAMASRARDMRLPCPPIVVVDAGMDAETRAVCEALARDIGGLRICSAGELPGFLEGELQN